MGSWNAVYELLPRDEHGNAAVSDLLLDSSSGCYVDAKGKLVALLGVKDLVVVDTPDALLIADRHRAQEVGNTGEGAGRQTARRLAVNSLARYSIFRFMTACLRLSKLLRRLESLDLPRWSALSS